MFGILKCIETMNKVGIVNSVGFMNSVGIMNNIGKLGCVEIVIIAWIVGK